MNFGRRLWPGKRLRLPPFLLAAVLLLSGAAAAESCGLSVGAAASAVLRRGTATLIGHFWYPAITAARPEYGETETISGWLAGFILSHSSYYNNAWGKDGNGETPGEADPSYRHYLENMGILEEYQNFVQTLSDSSVFSGSMTSVASGGSGGTESMQAELGTEAGSRLLAGKNVSGVRYMEEQLADYDFLMSHFYTVHPTAAAGRDLMKAEEFLSEDFSLPEKEGNRPQILIYHTHSQEEFADYSEGNREATIVGVGDYLAELLKKKGYSVIHDKSVYDLRDGKLDRSRAYTYALEGISAILEKNPSVEVVIDLHRDGVSEGTRLVTEIDGKETATIMFFNGTSETPDGPIDYLENPYRSDNLAFSFQLKLCAEACYPGFTRNIYLKGLRYNLHLRPRSTLIEVGAQNNTFEEAKNAMEPLAELLDMVLR